MAKTLLERTLELAREATPEVARDACIHVGASRKWFDRLVDGDYKDPGVNKIEKLHKFLRRRVTVSTTSSQSG